MHAKLFYLVIFSILSFSCISFLGASDFAEGYRSLFNGKDLEGWHGNQPHQLAKIEDEGERAAALEAQQAAFEAHWRVEGDELVNDGNGPYATTDEDFGDIAFLVEYKTVPLADSGIYLRGTPQVQIWDTTEKGGKWDKGADKGSGGLWNNRPGTPGQDPLVLADNSFGEWNQVEVIQLGSRTWVELNDAMVVDGAVMENFWDQSREKPLPATGPIHLQTHGGEIRWRNIFVREIGSEEANLLLRGDDGAAGFVSIFNGEDLEGWAGATENYEVIDGAIGCREGKGGVLYWNKDLEDFIVRLEFLLPPGGNNGLAIRYPGQGDPAYAGMCELQVLDDTAERYQALDPRQVHGSAYAMVGAHTGYLRPVGEWNYQEVTVEDSRVKVELNGTVILDAELGVVTEFMNDRPHPGKDRASGYFGFAGHKDPVMFRNIAVKEL
ncbi:MAG: DUF1080 domain-containing protein [Verrucomicrobiota bacterium]